LLGGYPDELVSASYRFGKHVGMAFELVDDVLDVIGSLLQLGKPSLSDLKAGLATAPVLLYACRRVPRTGINGGSEIYMSSEPTSWSFGQRVSNVPKSWPGCMQKPPWT
jgi:hypothetical protein